jgi:putative ABC transport system substrate-binding protein
MRRREFIKLVSGVAVVISCSARAQQPARGTVSIGILSPPGIAGISLAFVEALAKLGYQQEKNLTILFRAAKTSAELAILAQELVSLKPDIMITTSKPPTLALKHATATIPIVMIGVGDPIATGLCRVSPIPAAILREPRTQWRNGSLSGCRASLRCRPAFAVSIT